jgi:ADP-heptose:LPS heptosyltransferase
VKIVIVRALFLGDMLCAVPALRALRRLYPQAHVALVGLPWATELVGRYHDYLDRFIEFRGWPGIPEVVVEEGRIDDFLHKMRAEKWDLAIQMHGNGTFMNEMINQMGAKRTAGFYVNEKPGKDWYPYPNRGHEIERWLTLMKHLGATQVSAKMEFPLTKDEVSPVAGDYVVIHPGAKDNKRRWSPDYFAELATQVHQKGLQVVITGVESERQVVETLIARLDFDVIDLVGKTSLGELGALLKEARLLICNNTGVMHLAAALEVPSVVISLGDEPERWNPLDRHLHRVIPGFI